MRPCQLLHRLPLRRSALRLAARGWHVVPGACLVGTRFDCGEPGCPVASCHPALANWEKAACHDLPTVRRWWRWLPYAVLLATGRTLDAIEVPAALGRSVAGGVAGPVAVTPNARWLFLVRPQARLIPELHTQADVVLHGPASWVPVPPTESPDGRVRWEVPPEEYDWRLPDSYTVQQAILRGIRHLAEMRL